MKKELSRMQSTEKVFPAKDENGIVDNKRLTVTRRELEESNKDLIEKIPVLVNDLTKKLKKLNIELKNVDEVILAGGPANMP
jgi:molecular chaperone DnaK (HSP70)